MTQTDPETAPPERTPWYRSVAFRMALLFLLGLGLSGLIGAVSRYIAPF